jgi:hypothetical protein
MTRMAGIATAIIVLLAVAHEPATGRTAVAATPYLQLVGTVPIAGQATVVTGDTVRAFGSGFCGSPGCSQVILRIGTRIAARGIEVGENGTFRAAFTVVEDPGRYTVTASQSSPGGVLEDSAMLVVGIGDVEEPSPEVTLRLLNGQDGVFLTAVHPSRCCARKVAFFQRRVSPGHWRTIKRVKLNRKAARRFAVSLPLGISKVRVLVPSPRAASRPLVSRPLLIRR